ncbi:OPT super [Entomophthora muscae]|uniref:OPT super n=1 Tax=Entomophthora muscae TaxID=34485 RepID=A0ACC2STK0_9FUNG|nr:OPT super [Entomophthora muscae]
MDSTPYSSYRGHRDITTYSDSDSPPASQHESPDPDEEIIEALSERDAQLPDITLRGVLLGLMIGSVLSFTNMYFGLQSGWISLMSLQSSLIAFGLGRLMSWHRGKKVARSSEDGSLSPRNYLWYDLTLPFGIKENVFIQTCAVATAAMPLAGGFVGIIPALGLLTEKDRPDYGVTPGIELSADQLILWGLGIAFFGVFFAIPLRHQVIIKEKLKFPSGTATAQMIQLLHKSKSKGDYEPEEAANLLQRHPDRSEEELTLQWQAFLATFGVSGTSTLLITKYPRYAKWPIFNWIHPKAYDWQWLFSPTLSYMGQGIIMGLPTCLSMLLGAVVGWGILSPLSFHMGWAPGNINDTSNGPGGWILWTSLAVMIADSVISLSLITYREVSAQYYSWREVPDTQTAYEPVIPHWALCTGLVVSTVACILSIQVLFNEIPSIAILMSILIGCVLSMLAVRALGETDLNPVSGIGKISQVFFGILLPGNVVGNLVAGGVAEAGAMQAGEMMQDLKTGHLLNAQPRAQFYGQLIGSFVSVFVSVLAYQLYTTTYTIPGPEFAVPTAQVWLDMARLVNGHPLPPRAGLCAGFFAMIFALIPLAKSLQPNSAYTRYLPSGIAFAIGIYNPPTFTLTRLTGAFICEAYIQGWWSASLKKLRRAVSDGTSSYSELNRQPVPAGDPHSDRFYRVLFTVIASGLVLGEGTMSIAVLLYKVFSH